MEISRCGLCFVETLEIIKLEKNYYDMLSISEPPGKNRALDTSK
jgi:hypothetical protein